jgi:DNA-directed RNA polymerase I and III subunit RPAC2
MSVNEVRLKQAVDAFVVRGTGPANSRTFCIGDEDHTLGNAVRHILMQNEQVGFAGYSVPHPSEAVVQIRVQTVPPPGRSIEEAPTALETLKVACQTLSDQCDFVLEQLEEILPEAREDRLNIEKLLLEDTLAYEGVEEEDEEEEDKEPTRIDVKPER